MIEQTKVSGVVLASLLAVAMAVGTGCSCGERTEHGRSGSAVYAVHYRCGYLEYMDSDRDGDGTLDGHYVFMREGRAGAPGMEAREMWVDSDEDGSWDVMMIRHGYGGITGAMTWYDSDDDGRFDVVLYDNEAIRRFSRELKRIPWSPGPTTTR